MQLVGRLRVKHHYSRRRPRTKTNVKIQIKSHCPALQLLEDGLNEFIARVENLERYVVAREKGSKAGRCKVDGNVVREVRLEYGMTQREFALLVGVDHATVNRWERGKCSIKPPSGTRILEIRGWGAAKAQAELAKLLL